jgi:hypothetical protein
VNGYYAQYEEQGAEAEPLPEGEQAVEAVGEAAEPQPEGEHDVEAPGEGEDVAAPDPVAGELQPVEEAALEAVADSAPEVRPPAGTESE